MKLCSLKHGTKILIFGKWVKEVGFFLSLGWSFAKISKSIKYHNSTRELEIREENKLKWL